MNANRIIGYTIFVLGIGIFAVGMIVTPHAANLVANVTGNYTGHMSRYLIAATLAVFLGLLLAIFGGTGKAA